MVRRISAVIGVVGLSCVGDPDWWMGEGEPEYSTTAASEIPLTIYQSQPRTELPMFNPSTSEARVGGVEGMRPSEPGGIFHLDGKSLDSNVVLILEGALHRFDGPVERHVMAIQPEFHSKLGGAANPEGFLRIDLKQEDRIHVYERNGWPLGTMPGVFRGDIIATRILLHGGLAPDLTTYLIRPGRFGERPPNLLRDVEIRIRPVARLSILRPKGNDPCQGAQVVDATLSRTPLSVAVEVDGFPAGRPVTVEVRYRVPHESASTLEGHLWDYVSGLFTDEMDETVRTAFLSDPTLHPTVAMPDWITGEPAWGSDIFVMDVEVRAYNERTTGPSAQSARHQLTVVAEGEEVIVDHFGLCPAGDAPCHDLRDANAPANVIARRNVIEWMALRDGRTQTITRPLGRCSGGSAVGGSFADDCVVYRESTDTELSYNLSAELNFELSIDGQAHGSASWGRVLDGIGGADLAAALKASLKLEADLTASFATSQVWRNHHSLDVIYDPSQTQLQWWRVVTPRLHFVEVASLDACGASVHGHEIFLSDLRDSRLILACESVPRYDSVCHAVEPTDETVAACQASLIDPRSERGLQCLAPRGPR